MAQNVMGDAEKELRGELSQRQEIHRGLSDEETHAGPRASLARTPGASSSRGDGLTSMESETAGEEYIDDVPRPSTSAQALGDGEAADPPDDEACFADSDVW